MDVHYHTIDTNTWLNRMLDRHHTTVYLHHTTIIKRPREREQVTKPIINNNYAWYPAPHPCPR